ARGSPPALARDDLEVLAPGDHYDGLEDPLLLDRARELGQRGVRELPPGLEARGAQARDLDLGRRGRRCSTWNVVPARQERREAAAQNRLAIGHGRLRLFRNSRPSAK